MKNFILKINRALVAKTKIFTLFFALAASVGTMVAESGTCGDNLTWDLTNGVLTISGTGTMNDYYGTSPWSSYHSSILEVVIGNQVTSIGNQAFYGCSGLTSVTIPNSVTSIGEYAFGQCSGLTSMTIPNSVTSIGYCAFVGCSSLTSPVYIAHVFAYMPASYSESYAIPDGIESIAGGAFYHCSGLTSVTIPNSVTSIGYGAFDGCSGLTSVTIPNSVTSIGNYAFKGCSGLTNIEIPNSVTSIGEYTFDGCTSLTSVTIGNSVTSIGNMAFSGCTSLTSVTIPSSVTSIGGGAFFFCTSLTAMNVAADNAVYCSIDGVLFNKAKTTLVQYPGGKAGTYTIPNSVTSIGVEAFVGCSGLTSVTIPSSVTSIGGGAFYDCTSLTAINVAADNAAYCSIDGVLFNKAKTTLVQYPGGKAGTYTIPNSVTSIGEGAFCGCSGLTNVTIPNSVTSIGDGAFAGCSGLASITCEAVEPPTCTYVSFMGVSMSIPLYVLANSVDLYKAADKWKEFTNILPIAAETTDTDSTIVDPGEHAIDISWPEVDGAYTYELVIKDKNGNVVCTLVFNAQGQLTSIAFNAPARGDAPQKTQTAGFAFTVTGLDSGKAYDYTLTAKNEGGTVLKVEEGSFTTKAPQGIDDVIDPSKATKIIRDGQVLIQKGEKVFDLRGQEVK